MDRRVDVAVVGGGPAGLAVAIAAARRGIRVVVLEQRDGPPDKACGEGIMPKGVRALHDLGVPALLSPHDCATFPGIRYVDSQGLCAEGQFRHSAGLAVRRVALVRAMASRATELGAEIQSGTRLASYARTPHGFILQTQWGPIETRFLVAADGLASRLRRAEGLEVKRDVPGRFGLRRHYRLAPWCSSVEVHLGARAEAYVTPISRDRIGVAFLWEGTHADGAPPTEPDRADRGVGKWHQLERRFPELSRRLEGAAPDSEVRGAGPFDRASRARTGDRFALVGDAAG